MTAQSYNDCVRQWSDPLYRFVCKSTGHAEDARDIVQSAFETLWEKRASVEPDKAKAFLFQVGYNHALSHVRDRKSQVPVAEHLHVYEPADGADLRQLLDRALSQLEPEHKSLVLLKDYEGYSYDQIADITGLTPAQVRVYLHRSRKTLRQLLGKMERII